MAFGGRATQSCRDRKISRESREYCRSLPCVSNVMLRVPATRTEVTMHFIQEARIFAADMSYWTDCIIGVALDKLSNAMKNVVHLEVYPKHTVAPTNDTLH